MRSVLITGANRGIGRALAQQYAADGWTVHATARRLPVPGAPDHMNWHELDVRSIKAINALAARIEGPLDVVIANAGIMGERSDDSQVFGSLDYIQWADVLQVNTLGAVATCEAFLPHLEKGRERKMIAITSQMGSIADASQDYIAYRTSKAALNMAMTAAAPRLLEKGIAVGVLHPGWVQTDMGGSRAPLGTEESASGLRHVIASLKPGEKANFLTFSGQTLPW